MPMTTDMKARDNPVEICTNWQRIIFNPIKTRITAMPVCKNINFETKLESRKYRDRSPIIANMLEE